MILDVKELKKYFLTERGIFSRSGRAPQEARGPASGFIKAVDGISFSLQQGEILGIVGESGCGKTTLAKLILKLIEPTSGEIIFSSEIQKLRKDAGIVFQDPFLSLDPRMRIKDILLEPLLTWDLRSDRDSINKLLGLCGLNHNILTRFPAQLSGGERQRVCLTRSLASCPKLLVLDEPLSSLDSITQKQILDLLLNLKKELKMSYIFISHNIAVVKKISSRVMVMFEGKVLEEGDTSEVFLQPKSNYTKKLLEAAS